MTDLSLPELRDSRLFLGCTKTWPRDRHRCNVSALSNVRYNDSANAERATLRGPPGPTQRGASQNTYPAQKRTSAGAGTCPHAKRPHVPMTAQPKQHHQRSHAHKRAERRGRPRLQAKLCLPDASWAAREKTRAQRRHAAAPQVHDARIASKSSPD